MAAAPLAHPRDAANLEGCEGAEHAFLDALERGRLHHAWLLVGPEGVGKATFAYRAARRLLGARPEPAFGVLGADPEDPVFRQVAGRAHPDLTVLERDDGEARARKSIPVDEARELPEFFSKSPGRAAYRVAIIDTADDLNPNAANAVLKTLEEPPARGVLLLISHRPGALLPTIRSRCRRLVFTSPPAEAAAAWLMARADLTPEAALRYLKMARGAPGRALRLASAGALEIDEEARELVDRLPRIEPSAAQAMADRFRGPEGAQRFALVMDRIAAALHDRAAAGALDGRGGFERWAEAWTMADELPGEVEGINLDRADAFFTALGRLAALGLMLIDSHVNLHAPQFDADREAVIKRARAAGVRRMVTISDKVSAEPAVRAISEAHPDIWHTVGTHPHEAKEDPNLTPERLVALAAHPRVVGIGETGLDFHYDLSPRDVQARVFRAHIAAARATGLPLVVHAREADDVMGDILEEEHAAGPFKLLMHCYTSGPDLLARAAALGAWFSVSGIAAFKGAEDVRQRVREMPADRIVVETDCPYLAPPPHRGRRNEPAYVGLVLAKLAEIRGWGLGEAEDRAESAFFALFDRIPR